MIDILSVQTEILSFETKETTQKADSNKTKWQLIANMCMTARVTGMKAIREGKHFTGIRVVGLGSLRRRKYDGVA